MLVPTIGIGFILTTALAVAAPLSTVTLDCEDLILPLLRVNSSLLTDGTFTGLTNTSSGIVYFRGVRFADAPVGNLRWRAPVSPPSTHLGHVNASQVLQSFLFLHFGVSEYLFQTL